MIYIIRHAQSEYNEAQAYEQALAQHSVWTENLEVKFSGKYIDCGITEKGKEQCQSAVQALADKQIDFVFCSPLKRAIQTAQNIFGQEQPMIVVKELMEGLLSSCDISDFRETHQFFQNQVQNGTLLFQNFDNHWQLEALTDPLMVQQIQISIQNGSTIQEAILDKIKQISPKDFEDCYHIRNRVQNFKQFLTKFVQENPGKNIAIVGHSNFFNNLIAKEFDEEGQPKNTKWMYNCEVRQYDLI